MTHTLSIDDKLYEKLTSLKQPGLSYEGGIKTLIEIVEEKRKAWVATKIYDN